MAGEQNTVAGARWWRAQVFSAVTVFGWSVCGCFLICLVMYALLGWSETVFVAGTLAVLLLSAAPYLFGRFKYTPELLVAQNRVVAGDTLKVTLQITNIAGTVQSATRIEVWAGAALLAVRVPRLKTGETHTHVFEVAGVERGVLTIGPVQAIRRDPLGIVSKTVTWDITTDVFVYPQTVKLAAAQTGNRADLGGITGRRLTDSDLSFYALRDYLPGDQIRHIDWRATARSGSMLVRQYQQTQLPHTLVLLDAAAASYPHAADFELAVSSFASLALAAVTKGAQTVTAAVTNTAVTPFKTCNTKTPTALLDDCCRLQPQRSSLNFKSLRNLLRRDVTNVSEIVFVTGTANTETLENFLRTRGFANRLLITAAADSEMTVGRLPQADTLAITVGYLSDLAGAISRATTGGGA